MSEPRRNLNLTEESLSSRNDSSDAAAAMRGEAGNSGLKPDTGGASRKCVALYVMPDGPYPSRVADWYGEARDAKTYAGPLPVVAHPPCGPWGPMRGLCSKQDKSCAPMAVLQVRAFGGVLEHPALSALWDTCRLPPPGRVPDRWGGQTFWVNQVAWGHPCRKPTWLYVVGVPQEVVLAGIRTGGIATHRVTSGPGGPTLPSATKRTRSLTPPAFADWLISLAEQAVPPGASRNREGDVGGDDGSVAVCGECAHFAHCRFLFQCKAESTLCDWIPSRFVAREQS